MGTENKSFTTKDGRLIEGTDIYTKQAIDQKRGKGHKAERFFLSAAKLATLDFTPKPGQTVEVFFNRYGKVETMRLVDDVVDIS